MQSQHEVVPNHVGDCMTVRQVLRFFSFEKNAASSLVLEKIKGSYESYKSDKSDISSEDDENSWAICYRARLLVRQKNSSFFFFPWHVGVTRAMKFLRDALCSRWRAVFPGGRFCFGDGWIWVSRGFPSGKTSEGHKLRTNSKHNSSYLGKRSIFWPGTM